MRRNEKTYGDWKHWMVGCSYNACKFCNLFKHLQFRVLPLEQIAEECKRVVSANGKPRKVFLGDGNAFTRVI